MGEIVSTAGIVFSMATSQIANVGSVIMDTPILLFSTVCGVAFVGVTLFKRLLSVGL